MRFVHHKRRSTPAIIIVALIDILIVLLIFLIVTTTFKQQPALQLSLPESNQPKQGAAESTPVLITVAKSEPYFYLGPNPVTLERLENELKSRAMANPDVQVTLRADAEAPFGKIVNVMDAAKAAKVKNINALTQQPAARP
jgi:biopolymer transport protein ExbD